MYPAASRRHARGAALYGERPHLNLVQVVDAEAEIGGVSDVAWLAPRIFEVRNIALLALVIDDFPAHGIHRDRVGGYVHGAVRDARPRIFVERSTVVHDLEGVRDVEPNPAGDNRVIVEHRDLWARLVRMMGVGVVDIAVSDVLHGTGVAAYRLVPDLGHVDHRGRFGEKAAIPGRNAIEDLHRLHGVIVVVVRARFDAFGQLPITHVDARTNQKARVLLVDGHVPWWHAQLQDGFH